MPPKRRFEDKLAARLMRYSKERKHESWTTVRELINKVHDLAHTMNSAQKAESSSNVPTDKSVLGETDMVSVGEPSWTTEGGRRIYIDITIPVDGGMSNARIEYDSDRPDGPPLNISIQTEPEDGVEERGYENYALAAYRWRRGDLFSTETDDIPHIAMTIPDGSEVMMAGEEFMYRAGHRLEDGIKDKMQQVTAARLGEAAAKDMTILVEAPDSSKR